MINVSTGEFYGPFDLLLDLIRKAKYDIYDVKISEITNKYIEEINTLDIPADETADFILIATQLLYIKTRSLIKDTVIEEEEDEDYISEDELIKRLIEYKKIKSIIPIFRILEEEGSKRHFKLQEDLSKFREQEVEIEYNVEKLKIQLDLLIKNFFHEDTFEVDEILNVDEYSLEKYNNKIKLELIKDRILSISKMLSKVKTKSEAIVIFLSILELSKSKELQINQNKETLEIIVTINEEVNEQARTESNN